MSSVPTTEILVTADNVDLTNCAREQIHLPRSIQPHGVLVIAHKETLHIVQVSENTQAFLGCPPDALIGTPIATLFNATDIQRIQDCLNQDFHAINPLRVELNEQLLNLIVHENQGFVFLELEPIDAQQPNGFLGFYSMTRKVIDDIQNSRDLEELSQVIVDNVRQLTGFDRVMIYRFLEDDSGHVIAESKQTELDSFYDLHYPATDIPEPARRLYKLNPIRLICDIDYQPIALPNHPQTNEPFDLSYANLRSVSPIHLEYLQNMGVQSSMSISLVHEDRLWGLIACHHYCPKYLSYEVRTACEFLGKVMSLNLVAKEERRNLYDSLVMRENLPQIVEQLSTADDIPQSLTTNIKLLQQLIRADGVAVCFEGKLDRSGLTPTEAQIQDLAVWLKEHRSQNFFCTDSLSKIYAPAHDFAAQSSGIVILYLSQVENSYIIWFRPEVAQTVKWGGNPQKAAKLETDGTITLSPRTSFATWKQEVTGQSLPWLKYEIQQVMELRNLLVDIVFKKSNELVELNFELQRSNDELDAFAYIASHDLKEPLRGIYNYSYLLLEDYENIIDADGTRKLNMLMTLTKRMEKLIDSLLYYSRLGRQELSLELTDLEAIISQDIQLILKVSQQKNVDIRIPRKLPKVYADKTLVEELLMNLITNGLKYNKQNEKWIEVGYTRNPKLSNQPIFYVRDNGIGIAPQHQEIIFRIFKRLHGKKKFGGGTGAGLTIVKKIIERHNGMIWVESQPGEGSTFYFTLTEETTA